MRARYIRAVWFLLSWLACGFSPPDLSFLDTAPVPERPSPTPTRSVSLAHVEPASLSLPPTNRPEGATAPDTIELSGPFRATTLKGKSFSTVYAAAMPFHVSLLPTREGGTHVLGNHPPPGLRVFVEDGGWMELPFAKRAAKPVSWGFDAERLYVGMRPGAAAPSKIRVVFPRAAAAERALNLATSGQTPIAFSRRSTTLGATSHRGLYLPPPAEAVYRIPVPERGTLAFGALLVPPSFTDSASSDGATVVVSVRHEGTTHELGRHRTEIGAPSRAKVDLSRFAGQTVELVLATEPGGTPDFDYVLLEDPVVYTPSDTPRRIVLLFVDTLRPDHLGYMGYARPTSPILDRWATHAAVFSEARTVAPWTLPSALAALSGEQPELWSTTTPLAEHLSAAGWRTDAFVTNAFLSQVFDTHRGWDHFAYDHVLPGPKLVKRATDALEAHGDRDQLLMVHFMEPHIPYDEPWAFQGLFAGDAPDGLEFPLGRLRVNRWTPDMDGFDAVRDYLIARYDQNIRAADHAIGPLLEAAGPTATVALFSDHGEAFWEHGEFEHGHALHDELLKVALTIRSPGVRPGRFDAPVSLLDLTPTLLEIAGVSAPTTGRSLVPLTWGDEGVADAFAARPHAFGRPLYGSAGWGVVHGTDKWWTQAGYRYLYDLAVDPAEQNNVSYDTPGPPMQPHADQMQVALGRPVKQVWRMEIGSAHGSDVTVTVSHPEGFSRAWLSYDPRGRAVRPEPTLVDGRVQLVHPAFDDTIDSLYLVPNGDPRKPEGLAVTFVGKTLTSGARVETAIDLGNGARRNVFLRAGDPRFSALVDMVWVPEPAGETVPGFHPSLQEQLQELGYLE